MSRRIKTSNALFIMAFIIQSVLYDIGIAELNNIRIEEVQPMNNLPLNNEDYWNNPQAKLNDYTWNLLVNGKETIVIDCPEIIFMDIRKKIPVVMVGVRDAGIEWKDNFEGKTIGICHNINNGSTYIGVVIRGMDRKSDVRSSPGEIAEDYIIDLRTFLGIPWELGEYKIWFVYYDLLSNGIQCKLSSNEKADTNKEEDTFFENVSKNAKRRDVLPNSAIKYERIGTSEKIDTGIIIKEKQVDFKKDKIISIDGKIPVLSYQLVQQDEQKGPLAGVVAVLPFDIMIIRTHHVYETLSLGVPCYSKIVDDNGNSFAQFRITINSHTILRTEKKDDEQLFIYAFSGKYSSGPMVIR